MRRWLSLDRVTANAARQANGAAPGGKVAKARNNKVTNKSPYTLQNVEAAIIHLENVLNMEGADSLFAQAYWRDRLLQACATPGLIPAQKQRLERLLDRIAER
jgi:hypothetical protein